MISEELSRSIDLHAQIAQVENIKNGLRARCWLNGKVSSVNKSLAQLRRDRVAERLQKVVAPNEIGRL